jgi:poly(3-hydroxybutyrate) depolymerase
MMKRGQLKRAVIKITLSLLLFSAPVFCAEVEELAKGKVIENVICKASAGESYALYLPTAYTVKRRWPVVYGFDPRARGAVAVERFKEAAEKYGYIIVASNTSRNGSWESTAAAMRAMWQDTHARFALDDRRVYTAGFSGGARAASNIALALKGDIAGVIACGAGFPAEVAPTASIPFVFFATAGVDDFNYPEVQQLGRTLDGLGVVNRIEVFEGAHSWAPPELCAEAIAWMEIQAMKKGRRDKDEALIQQLFKGAVEKARAAEAAGAAYQAYLGYEQAAQDFKGLADVAELERKAAELKESKEVKQAVKQQREQEAEQKKRFSELGALKAQLWNQARSATDDRLSPDGGSQAGYSETRSQALSDLRRIVADLRKKSQAKESTPERAVARRTLNQFFAFSFETSQALMRSKNYTAAAANLAIDAEVMPESPYVLYNLACAYSLKGDKKQALDALRKAVQKGFANVAELESNKDLAPLREEAGYKKILEEIGKKTN